MINLPSSTKKWVQANQSDLFGNIHITKNITFDTQGYLRLSYSPRSAMDNTVDADFDLPAVIIFSPDYEYFIGTWDEAFQSGREILVSYPTQIATSGVPTTDAETDAVIFNGLMPVSQDTDVDYYDISANTWTDTNISLTASGQHPLVNFLSLSALAVANVNTVKLYSSPLTATPTLITTLTINSDFKITGMCYFNQFLYIATKNVYGGKAALYVWSGSGTSASQVYEVDSNVIYSICAHKQTVYMLSGNGALLRFSGGGLEEVAAFPIYYTNQSIDGENNLAMYKNVMKSSGDLLYILFSNNGNGGEKLISQPDGVWCYDENVGLYHRYSVSNALVRKESINTTAVDTSTNQITVASNYPTGTEIYYRDGGGTSIPELVDDVKYYVINVDSTHIQLATTLANAIAGTEIDLTGTGSNFQKIIVFPNVDFGQYITDRVASLCVIDRPNDTSTGTRIYGTDVMWGSEVSLRDNSSVEVLGVPAPYVESRGYFITPKILASGITDTFNLVTLKFSPLMYETDKIIIKYRTVDDMRQSININNSGWAITWTSTTTFTTTQADWANAVVGDEVEILQGAGGGLLAHISTISENAGTYTVTLDDTFDNYVSGDVGIAVFRNWIKWETIEYGDNNAENYFLSQELGATGKFIQLKIELRGIQVRIEELSVDNKYHLPSSN